MKKNGKEIECGFCKIKIYRSASRLKKVNYCSNKCNHRVKNRKEKRAYKQMRVNGKVVRCHRHIMQEYLGRKLERSEHVHHINNNPHDNRIENLEVLLASDHIRLTHLKSSK